ncbi:MAG: hypothetical protein JWR51_1188 [Devosia sp.]|uniref:DUF2975 domain-containing protein n=1 Tax=Devosia sp. TaxID=1871048 RepID=UPI0026215062|nr:DUF2975 domain-containing protein [Devosia sp.]MDB5528085.1 hypothetical protein [Devosia sp.]
MIDTKAPPMDTLFSPVAGIAVDGRTALLFRVLAVAATALAALLPLGMIGHWLTVAPDDLAQAMRMAPTALGDLNAPLRLGAAGLSLLAVLPLSWGLVRVRACFTEFAQGRPFVARGIAGLRDFAIGMGLSVVAKPVSAMLLSILLSWNAPAGQRQLIIQFDSDTLIMALFAATIAALGWAMQKAAAIAEENSQFV